jgi:GNAT superfamily N-acetyltransferase
VTAGPSPPCRIRPARVDEARALTALCRRAKAVWGYDAAFMALAGPALRVTPEAVAAGDVWIAEHDGVMAGVVALAAGDLPGTATLDLLYVAPEVLRRGIGAALLDHARREAQRRGVATLRVLADPHAAPFYERQGARRLGEAPSDAGIPGRMLPVYLIDCAA